ncbi:MAG: hypothetical protein VYE68_08430 [Acidobacteriota bacterium]|nr:hypothetical protein [Acidobacteriota bacterium]
MNTRGYDRQRWPRLGVIVWLVIAQLTRASAQSEPPTLTVTLAPTVVTVGDPITVVLAVDHASDTTVVWPDPVTIDPLELVDTRLPPSTPNGERLQSTLELVVTAFELGELSIPAFSIQVVDREGDRVDLTAETPGVTIASVGRDDEDEIRDIKDPLTIPFDVLTLWPWIVGLVVLGVIGYQLYRRRGHREQPETPVPITPPRPAHVLAHEALDALEASGLLERGEVKTYHIRVSDIMRVYVEGRFGVDAMEMTTPEVLSEISRARP